MKLTEKIHILRIDFKLKINQNTEVPRFVNALLIFGDKITLVDTGVKGSEKIIYDYIQKQNRKISEIETIILSHSHPDHIGSAAKIKNDTNCKVIAPIAEQTWIENIKEQCNERPVPGFLELVDIPVTIDILLNENHDIKLAEDITLKISNSPGHSKGMFNILFVEDRIIFTADSVPLKGDIPNYNNYYELIKSLDAIKSNTRYETLLTSWTPPLTDKSEISQIIADGEEYMHRIDSIVKKHYRDNSGTLNHCKQVVEELGLPPFLANPIVDKAFRSHLEKH